VFVSNLWPGEEQRLHCKANAVIIPQQHGLSDFVANQLLPLVGLAGQESIGGHLDVTDLRVLFTAHRFNRMRGTLSTPLDAIVNARSWRSGLAVGVEIETSIATQRYITWSGRKILAAIDDARARLTPDRLARLAAASGQLDSWGSTGLPKG